MTIDRVGQLAGMSVDLTEAKQEGTRISTESKPTEMAHNKGLWRARNASIELRALEHKNTKSRDTRESE